MKRHRLGRLSQSGSELDIFQNQHRSTSHGRLELLQVFLHLLHQRRQHAVDLRNMFVGFLPDLDEFG